MGISFGGGSSSGSQQTQLTPEQSALLKAQTGFLTNTAFPAYQQTIGMAGGAYNQAQPASINAANTAMDVAGRTGALQEAGGSQAYGAGLQGQQGLAGYQSGLGKGLTDQGAGGVSNLAGYQQGLGQGLTGQGAAGLSSLFNPQYEQGQVQAALQAGRESARESQAGQNAMYGAAGGLGSSRMALADQNLSSLNAQRQATAAAGAQAQVQANKAAAGQALLGAGQTATGQAGSLFGNLLSSGQGALQQGAGLFGNLAGQGAAGLGAANQAAAARIGYGQTPQDLVSKYASVIYGTPQGSTTPNFAGTQGTQGQSSSKGFGIR
jgi:hypothetical protein